MARAVVGIDPNDVYIARARRLTPRALKRKVRYRQGAAERLRLAGPRFTVAVFSGSL